MFSTRSVITWLFVIMLSIFFRNPLLMYVLYIHEDNYLNPVSRDILNSMQLQDFMSHNGMHFL